MNKKRIAVFFGGRSPEHDVSIVTGLQALAAIDTAQYDAFPVYITSDGQWWIGEGLDKRSNYFITPEHRKKLTKVTLDLNCAGPNEPRGRLISTESSLFGGAKTVETFDVAVMAFHGLHGEDGMIQGLMDFANIPYTGMRAMTTGVLMDKVATKKMLHAIDVPTLPYAVLKRPDDGGYAIPSDKIEAALGDLKFPMILKPSHLGSSIGIAKVTNIDEIKACLPAVFEFDDTAILEPFVQNLTEFNVAVARIDGVIKTSTIERPKSSAELLDFKEKYLSGGGSKGGHKTGAKDPQASDGMLSLTRELGPDLPAEQEAKIRDWASRMYEALDGTGAPRVDFISNGKTGELWMNEVNPIPGSFGYFLWERPPHNLLFIELLSHLIEEAIAENKKRRLPADPVPKDAHLFERTA